MRHTGWALLAILVGPSCESRLPSGAASGEDAEVVGIYVLATVDSQRPPVEEYAGCGAFPTGQRPMCAIESGRLTLFAGGDFRMSLVSTIPSERPEILKGGYITMGRRLTYRSAAHGDFEGAVLAERSCAATGAPGTGVTFERGDVRLEFCRDPASLSTTPAGG